MHKLFKLDSPNFVTSPGFQSRFKLACTTLEVFLVQTLVLRADPLSVYATNVSENQGSPGISLYVRSPIAVGSHPAPHKDEFQILEDTDDWDETHCQPHSHSGAVEIGTLISPPTH